MTLDYVMGQFTYAAIAIGSNHSMITPARRIAATARPLRGEKLTQPDERDRQIAALRDTLSRLSQAGLRINESLEVEAALRGVLDGARSVTTAAYALITTLDDSGEVEDHLVAGIGADDAERLWQDPDGPRLFEYMNALSGSLRLGERELEELTRSIGLKEFRTPVRITAFMAAPILHQGARVGNIYVGSDEPGREFTQEDEDVLVMFAAQAAQVIANARRHRDEKRARAGLETLIDTSPVGVAVFDVGTYAPATFNREARRIIDNLRDPEQPLEDLLGLLTIRRADGREVSLMEFPLVEVLSTSEKVWAEEIMVEAPNGRSVTVLLNATPIRSEEGEVESVVVTMQDMTPLEEVERLRAEFLGMVSHELRMPLTSILGSATTMLDSAEDLDPAETRQFLRIILDQAGSMRDLIGNLLDVARIETGELPVNPEPAEVAALVDRARSAFLSAGGKNNLAIDLALDLPLVMADRRRIAQVIGNLLTNAARHSPGSSAIRVSAARDGVHVRVSVVDEGRGIPTERLPNLFRKFSRRDDDDPWRDTGLGLAICKGIVEAHGGRIWAENEGPGLGARFTFTIPAIEGAAAQRRSSPEGRRQETGDAEPILVVDDDPQMLRHLRKVLSDAGYHPIVTADPEEVIPLVEEHRPHLVLLDMVLPDSDGIELMRDIIAMANVPVIFLSAYRRDQVVARAFEGGAADYIVKPFSPTELVARVRAALRRLAEPFRPEPSEAYALGDLSIDYAQRLVTLAGRPVQLTATEYRLLFELSVNAGRVLTHNHLLRKVWGPKKPGNLGSLRTHLRRLRSKLGEDASNPTYFFAESKVGYWMAKGETQEEKPQQTRDERSPATAERP